MPMRSLGEGIDWQKGGATRCCGIEDGEAWEARRLH